ncbi:hypothetical protein L1987_56799 [Smallanthus sonchifolius]|uniref:Uncharacterized protein n=1 Tax=Smallanthus sonchifolius TaxID=185202 RepID=A0ACB9DAV4_9ASTR|nr:hypothetical protein L1987_56799 [Smallanthus sonchifolius]
MNSYFGLLVSITGLIVLLQFGNFVDCNKPQVPCYFIFGDSFVDSGNNNQLKSNWKANFPPYGIDFPKGHTGRFTNGRTFADIIGQFLGFDEFIPPYATATDDQISKGVNYASGGAGIQEITGSHNGDRASLDLQLIHHNSTISRIQNKTTFLKQCIYLINIGAHDFISNYYHLSNDRYYKASEIYKLDVYSDLLMQQYSRQLRTLYNLGGRKIVLFGLTQLGCSPYVVERYKPTGQACQLMVDDSIYVFNNRLKPLVDELNKEKSDARFIFINTTSILHRHEVAPVPPPSSPLATTIPARTDDTKLLARSCCPIDGDWACILNSVPCPSRSSSTYFDSVHHTEPTNIAIATRSYKALLPTDAYPYDIHHLTEV